MNLTFLPSLPLELSYPLLFGVLLVAGMLGGELARAVRAPRIIGYVAVGFAAVPLSEAMNLGPLLEQARIFVDLALGLVLFDLGRRMDLEWMRRDWTLAAAGLAESLFTFVAVFACLVAFDYTALVAGITAAIAMATSPAVVLLIVQDTKAEGQVTERALNLVALNSLFASILTTILLSSAHLETKVEVENALLHPAYLFAGSLFLGWLVASFARVIARLVEKTKDLHFTLIAGMVIGAVGLAVLLKLSVILALLAFGLFTRNDARNFDLLNVSLAPASRPLYIVLFVITGASLPLSTLSVAGAIGLALAGARLAGKFVGVIAFSSLGGLRMRQSVGLACALLPMSTLALMLHHEVARLFPVFGTQVGPAFLAMLIVMEIVGPFAVQWGLGFAGETAKEPGESLIVPLEFTHSKALTFGVELELMVLNTHDRDLVRGAPDLLARLEKQELGGEVKPELTESMIEVNSSVHTRYDTLLLELVVIRNAIVAAADKLNVEVAGGGAHPFHHWSERRIFPSERFQRVSELYGYLAKQFTVFGQHIHIGVESGDDAIYLTHQLAPYIPHFIALSASSPFSQGEDTSFDTSRLHAVSSFPLSGQLPPVTTWAEFNTYFDAMQGYGIVGSMKDFYWDIRPKPEYGTVEIRICDTPLTVDLAAQLAAYAQTLADDLLRNRRTTPVEPMYRVYGYNRFQACRFGFEGELVNPPREGRVRINDDIVETLKRLAPLTAQLGTGAALAALAKRVALNANDSAWLRERHKETKSLPDVVRLQAQRWRNEPPMK